MQNLKLRQRVGIDVPPARKGTAKRWTQAEEAELMRMRDELGLTWFEIAEQFPKRPYSGLRSKYTKMNERRPRKNAYSGAEDAKIFRLKASDSSWEQIERQFPGRTKEGLRKRWEYLEGHSKSTRPP